MPRAGWLAAGGLGIALATLAVQPDLAVFPGIAAGIVGLCMILLGSRLHRSELWATGCGLSTVGIRILAASLLLAAAPGAGSPPPTATLPWVGHVDRLGSTDGDLQRALLNVRPAATVDHSGSTATSPATQPAPPGGTAPLTPGPWPIYAWLPRYPIVAPGDSIAFTAALELPPPGPGFGDVIRQQGAVASVRLRDMDVLPGGGDPLAALESERRRAGELLARALPEPEAGLAAGILIGLRDLVDRDVAADFTAAGLSHVVAISGWNIAVVGAVIVSMLRRLPRRRRSIAVLLSIGAYTLLAGASPSVIRAAVMGAVVLVARESGRRGSAATALGLAVWLLLVIDPRMAGDVGFQLSVAATAGLLAWGSGMHERIAEYLPRRIPAWLGEAAAVSLAAQASTLPLILWHFGRVSLVSPLSNLIAAPIVAPAMLASLLGLLCGAATSLGVVQVLLVPAALSAWAGLAALVFVARISASLPFASVSLTPPLDSLAALLAAVVVAIAGTAVGRRIRIALRSARAPRVPAATGDESQTTSRARGAAQDRRVGAACATGERASATRASRGSDRAAPSGHPSQSPGHPSRRVIRGLAALAAVLAVSAAAVAAARPDGRVRLTVLDVGQGDAILLEGSRGARMLVDTGPDPDLLLRRLDERVPAWDRRLDLVVLTHPHEDHVSGMALLLARYRVKAIGENGMAGSGPGDRAYRVAVGQSSMRPAVLAAGDTIRLDNVIVKVIWPLPGSVPIHATDDGAAVNDASIVLDVRAGQRRMLLTGDIQDDVDPQLTGRGIGGPGEPAVDVLKVAHHGSRTATTGTFLAAIRPHIAVLSVGADNPYGHPSGDTLGRLEAAGAQTYRTDHDGSVTVSTDGVDLEIATTRTAVNATRAAASAEQGDGHGDPAPGQRAADAMAETTRSATPRARPHSHASGSARYVDLHPSATAACWFGPPGRGPPGSEGAIGLAKVRPL